MAGRWRSAALALGAACPAMAAPPLVLTYRGGADLGTAATDQFGAVFTVTGLSGVTRLPDGRFAAVMDNSDKIVLLAVTFNANGSIATAAITGGRRLAEARDFEDAAWTGRDGGGLWLCEEGTPSVRRYRLSDGALREAPATPGVFASRRDNFGFEGLSLDPAGRALWTANEEALTVDGSLSTSASGTVVRVARYLPGAGGAATAAQQFAWRTAPWHGSTISGARSGVSGLVALPDGRLLVLERSLAFSLAGLYQTRVYEAVFDGASEVSAEPGLIGAAYTPLGKLPLYTGSLTNVEGLCVGPMLGPGRYALLGIVDDGDPLSVNRLVAFELSGVVTPACEADVGTEGSADPLAGPDGHVTGVDFDVFVEAYFKMLAAPQGWLIADIADALGNPGPDGFITGTDFDRFVEVFFGGC